MPWHICVALLLLTLTTLALFLPYWVWWSVSNWTDGLGYVSGSTSTDSLRANVGLWNSHYKTTSSGDVACSSSLLTANACVCTPLSSYQASWFQTAQSSTTSTSTTLASTSNSAQPQCHEFDVTQCNTGLLTNGLVQFNIAAQLYCDATYFARYSKCQPKLDSNGAAIAGSAPNCPYGTYDNCMQGWIRATRAMFFISMGLLIIIIFIYLFMACVHPYMLPMLAMIALFLIFCNLIATLLGTIFGAIAFRLGCNNSWSRLPGHVWWHASMGIAIADTIIAAMFLIVGYFAYTTARRIRDAWAYNGTWGLKPTAIATTAAYSAPVQYADYGYEYYSYAPTYADPNSAVVYQGYGASPETDESVDAQEFGNDLTTVAPATAAPPLFVHPPPQ